MRKLLVITLLFVMYSARAQRISTTLTANQSESLNEQMVLLSAVGELTIGNTRTAYDLLNSLLEKNPQNSTALHYMAKSLALMGKIPEALERANQALQTDSTNNYFLQLTGQLLIEVKQYDRAQEIFDKLIKSEPANPQNYVLVGALAMETGQAKKAIEICNRYETLFGLDEQVIEIKRGALIEEKLYYEALEYMQQVVDATPNEPSYITMLGDMNAGLGLDKAAIDHYEQAIAMDSLQGGGYMALARYYEVKGNMKEHIEVLTRMFALQSIPAQTKIEIFENEFFTPAPYRDNMMAIRKLAQTLLIAHTKDIDVRLLYGRHLTYIGQIDAAQDHYTNMLEAGIKSIDVYDRLMDIYFHKEEYIKALDTGLAAGEEYPDNTNIIFRVIAAQWKAFGGKNALKSIKKALVKLGGDSLQSALYTIRADIYLDMKKSTKGFREYEKAIRMDPSNALTLNNYAYFLSLGGAQALQSIKRSLVEFHDDSMRCALHSIRGNIYHEMKKDTKAFEEYEKVLAIDPDNALVLNNYAYFLSLRKERLEDALHMANRACEIEKNFSTYLDTKAWVLFTMGRLDAAAAIQQQALAVDRTLNPELMIHYGDILYALGDDFMARNYWKKALEAGAKQEIIDEKLSLPKAVKTNK